jgi:tetratricopeptide (TPR) repeat protein
MLQGDNVDPEKIAMLEKNIGLALFYRGHYAEAVEHLDKALSYYWGDLPKHAASTAVKFASSLITFLLALYFPSRWFKRIPTERDAETVELVIKKAEAQTVIDPKRFFIESFLFHGKFVHFDLTRFKLGVATFASASSLFSFTGLSLGIGREVLDYVKPRLIPDDARQWITYDLMDTIHLLLKGQWKEIIPYNEDLVNRTLRIGETFLPAQHYYWHGLPLIYQGLFDMARLTVTKLNEIAEAYDNDIYRLLKYLLNVQLLIECRRMQEAIAELNRGIDLVRRRGWPQSALTLHSLEALTHLLIKEAETAEKSLDQADRIRSEVKGTPMQVSFFCRSRFECALRPLEESLGEDSGEEPLADRRKALRFGKMLIKTCQKAALFRTDSYRLMGVYYWLAADRKKALKWWHKAVSEGETLGARPQLARTYAEMGLRLCELERESLEPDVSKAIEPLRMAKTMFLDLGLQHDLEDLNSRIGRLGLDPSEV